MSSESIDNLVKVQVQCYAGHRADERPVKFTVWSREVQVVEILDQWIAPAHRYFKLKGDDGAVYILRHDEARGEWRLSFYSKITEGY